MAYRLCLKWGIQDPAAWMQSLPAGALNQWLAWDMVEPMGERWMQTAKLLEALYLPLYARADEEPPDASDFMPDRFYRPKVSAASILKQSAESCKAMANQVKSMFGFGGK